MTQKNFVLASLVAFAAPAFARWKPKWKPKPGVVETRPLLLDTLGTPTQGEINAEKREISAEENKLIIK